MQPNWPEQIFQIPIIKQAGLLECEAINAGSSNLNYKVTTEEGTWVVRLNKPLPGVNRKQEQKVLKLIGPLKISPAVIAVNPQAGYLITEFCTEPTWQQSSPELATSIDQISVQLRQLHRIPYDYLPSRLDQRINRYIQQINGLPEALVKDIQFASEDLNRLGFWSACKTLYHSDLNPNNLMGINNPLIIDWEFAGQGHALLDWLIMEHELQLDLSAYYPDEMNEKWLKPAKDLIEDMLRMWSYYQ